MKASIRDVDALTAVSPAALAAYAQATGWRKIEMYGDHSDVYALEGAPEVILPRHRRLGDYARVVSRLIEIFARTAEIDELSLYRDLVTADRDVIRIRVAAGDDGSVAASAGVDLLKGARNLILAAACSLKNPRPVYRIGANREAKNFWKRVRLGQTGQSSFALTLLTPVVPPRRNRRRHARLFHERDPLERRMTERLASALTATRKATDTRAKESFEAFSVAVVDGASANLCEALVDLIKPFRRLETSLIWARTRPMNRVREVIRFAESDLPVLRSAAKSLRDLTPRPNTRLVGPIWKLARGENKTQGKVTVQTPVDGHNRSVLAVLRQSDYERCVQAHKDTRSVIMVGDLTRVGQRWHLSNPRIEGFVPPEETPDVFSRGWP